jgi:hypothetical protein
MNNRPEFGALVISLDFELHWGVRDRHSSEGPYRNRLLGARQAIPQILDLFEEFGIAATWATVGFLFAESRGEREGFSPAARPSYLDSSLNPYDEPTGESESDDPLHYASSIIEQIRTKPRQEIATHTFSHYYCLEAGASIRTFAADLQSAITIARRRGVELRSIVFPRNQVRPDYLQCLRESGVVAYRGNAPSWWHRPRSRHEENFAVRAPRLADQYIAISASSPIPWAEVLQPGGLGNVPASMFLRSCSLWPGLEALRLQRIMNGIHAAAEKRCIFHLWSHPHNFGLNTARNLAFLRKVLQSFSLMRRSHGMRSLSMMEVADIAVNSSELRASSLMPSRSSFALEHVS